MARLTRRRFTARALAKRLSEFGDCCAECRRPVGGAAGLEWDHEIALELGGEDALANLRPLCRMCHRAKTAADATAIGKARRMQQRSRGIRRQARRIIPGSVGSGFRKRLNGDVVRVQE